MSSPDTAAYDRLSAKQAYFDTIILAPGTTTGTGNVALQNSPTFNGLSTSGIIGSAPFGDLVLTSARNIFLTANAAVTIGSNTFPNGSGTNGQVLTTNGAGSVAWTSPPGSGTVTSVAASVPAFLSIAGSPITGTGTLAISYSGTPLPVLNGGTGVTTSTGTGSVVLSASPTMTGALTIPRINGSGGGFGDLIFSSARNIFLSAAASVVIGSNNFPITTGSVGQVLVTNGVGAATWSGSPSLVEITGSGGGFGDLTLTSARIIYLNAANSVVIGSNNYPNETGTNGQVLTTNGSGTLTWGSRAVAGYATYGGVSPLPNNALTSYKPSLGLIQSSGAVLSYNNTNGDFTNNTGVRILVDLTYSLSRTESLAKTGLSTYGVELNGAGVQIGKNQVAAGDWSSGSTKFLLNNGEFFRVVCYQDSGLGHDLVIDSRMMYSYSPS